MEIRKFIFRLFFLLIAGTLSFYSCKKESSNSTGNPLTSSQTIQVQNSDAQDAIADKTEEDIDSKLDELQNNNYAVAGMKSYLAGLTDTVVITVDHPDTTTFPKVVTLTYYSYIDSSANEPIIKNGKITVTISSSNPTHKKLVSRSFVFDNFAVTTDSTTILLNGTRVVSRQKESVKFTGLQSVRISVTDNITAATQWAAVTTGSTDTLKFTRNVNKVRTAVSHFRNILYKPGDLLHFFFMHIASSDTITYTGIVTGINEKGDAYSKTITTPLTVTEYKGSLVVSSGIMTYVAGTDSYEVTFEADPAHKHFTLVTITNNLTGKTKSFDRRFGRVFRKWW
ncbi:MAG: hypothetical protein ABR927_16975 [Bacteroidales bacterium]|jgi:hypothetical protein